MPPTILICATNCGQRVAFQFDDHWPECHGMPMVREGDAQRDEHDCRGVHEDPQETGSCIYCGKRLA